MKFILSILLFCYISNQTEVNSDKERQFVSLCKAIASIKEIHNANVLYEYKGRTNMFVLTDPEFVKQDKMIDLDLNSFRLSIWFKRDLFFDNIPYWFELEEINQKKEKITIKFCSYNSVHYENKKPRIKGDVTLKPDGKGGYTIQKKKIKILPAE